MGVDQRGGLSGVVVGDDVCGAIRCGSMLHRILQRTWPESAQRGGEGRLFGSPWGLGACALRLRIGLWGVWGRLGRLDQRQDGSTDRLGEDRPRLDDSGEVDVGMGRSELRCGLYCGWHFRASHNLL